MDNEAEQGNSAYIQREREKKHRQIMNAIYNYKRSHEQIKMMDKVKQATKMEINLRFKNSAHNHNYKFPLFENSFDEDDDELQFPSNIEILYDLNTQAEVVKKSISTKTLSLDASRRVKSLEKEHVGEDEQIINKIHRRPVQIGKTSDMQDYLLRKNSLKRMKIRDKSNLRLPQLKKVPSEKKNYLQQIVGKKIHTQTSSPDSKRLAKYLKGVDSTGKQVSKDQPKKFFLQQC